MAPNANEIAGRARAAQRRLKDALRDLAAESDIPTHVRDSLERVDSLLGLVVVDAEHLGDMLRNLS
jgi:hypothetical protein